MGRGGGPAMRFVVAFICGIMGWEGVLEGYFVPLDQARVHVAVGGASRKKQGEVENRTGEGCLCLSMSLSRCSRGAP